MKVYSVKIISYISICSLVLFLSGFAWTLKTQYFNKGVTNINKPAQVTTEAKVDENKMIVALGDSLTRGTGDVEGKGYIGYLVDELEEKTSEKITLQNLGVKGYRSNQLLSQIQQTGVQNQIKNADVILVTIGGNDLFQSGQTILELNEDRIDELRGQYLENLDEIVKQLRGLNTEATLFLIGLYNPFIDLNDADIMTREVRQWNYETSELLDKYPQTVFVPTFDLFQLKVNDFLYTDKFHPNAKGYKLIAERVASLITW